MNDKPSWRDDFDEQFPGMLSEATDDGGYNARPYIKSFIQSLLDKQREELREIIGDAKEREKYDLMFCMFLDDLLTKLDEE